MRNVVTEEGIVEKANKLRNAIEGDQVKVFAEGKADQNEEIWKALLSMYQAESRDELVTLLGFSKSEVATMIVEAVEKLKMQSSAEGPAMSASVTSASASTEVEVVDMKPPVVSFAEPEREPTPEADAPLFEQDSAELEPELERTPSEVSASASATSDATHLAETETESTTTAPSLFGDDAPADDEGDFFSNIGANTGQQVLVPHTNYNYGVDSSVAATIGSRPSSAASASASEALLKDNTFKIYPANESSTDKLITKALVLGDFSSAVQLCLSTNRFADALLLAVRGGPDLLASTQKAYFEKQMKSHSGGGAPYLRLFQSIVVNDLADIVQNADLGEWKEIFVVLCTFANGKEEFQGLVEQLGRRLEFEYTVGVGKISEDNDVPVEGGVEPARNAKAIEFRKYATLTYLAAERLERLVGIWVEELYEEEIALVKDASVPGGSRYTAHAHALQTFIEKVTIFRSATNYTDADLGMASTETVAKTYKLATLYDRYFEYADLLASQGLLKEAAEILKLTPEDYKGSGVSGGDLVVRKRIFGVTASTSVQPVASTSTGLPAASSSRGTYGGGYGVPSAAAPIRAAVPPAAAPPAGPYGGGYQNYHAQAQSQTHNAYGNGPSLAQTPYGGGAPGQNAPSNTFTTANSNTFTPAAPSVPYNPYGNAGQQQMQAQAPLAPPQAPRSVATTLPPPPPPKRDNRGWNDAPPVLNPSRTSSAMGNSNKQTQQPITAPFPNSVVGSPLSPPTSGSYMSMGAMGGGVASPGNLPPPPRPGSVTGRSIPPPPGQGVGRQGQYPPPPPGAGVRPSSGMGMVSPPTHMMSPPAQPQQYGPPATRGPSMTGQTPSPPGPPFTRPPQPQMQPPPSGPYARATPPPIQSGPYAPPPGQGQAPPAPQVGGGGYAPPSGPGQQPSGMYAPPPGAGARAGPPQPPPPGAGPGPGPGHGGPPIPGAGAPPPSRVQKAGPPPPKYREFIYRQSLVILYSRIL